MTARLAVAWLIAAPLWLHLQGVAAAQDLRVRLPAITRARLSSPPPAPQTSTLSLADAVQLTITNSPPVSQSTERLRGSLGREQQARGAFDPQVHATPALRLIRQSVPPSLWSSLSPFPAPLVAAQVASLNQRDGQAEIDVGVARPSRLGVTWSGDLRVWSDQFTYSGAGGNPGPGIFDVPALFRSAITFALDVPLQKGGRISVQAPERATSHLVSAGRDDVRHTVAEAVLGTTLAYLRLVAQQERVRLLEASAQRQRDLLAVTGQQIQLGDLPRFEMGRAQARLAQVASLLSENRAALVQVRIELARAIGTDVRALGGAPVATETLPTRAAPIAPADVLLARAVTLRQDLRRASAQLAAAATLEGGARADLKRRVDLSVSGGGADLFDGARLPGTLGYVSPQGFYRAFTGAWQPFVATSLTVQLPFANNAARGRLRQAMAQRTAIAIETATLDRVIHENVLQARGELAQAALAMEHATTTVASSEEMLRVTLERFHDREATLIDTLLTEEDLTADQLRLVDERLAYASTLARLKFETGELVSSGADADGEVFTFQPGEFVGS